jgi:hypothetical protein
MINEDPENEELKKEMDTVVKERETLQATLEKEGAAFTKAKKILNDALAATQKRIQAEENAARQAELERQEAEAQRELLTLLFRKQELEATINDQSIPQEERDFAQQELNAEVAEEERIEEEKARAE